MIIIAYVSSTGTNLTTAWGGSYDDIRSAVRSSTIQGANCLRSLYFVRSNNN